MPDSGDQAIRTQQQALATAYAAGNPTACAVHHLNLSNHLVSAGVDPLTALAHRLAAALLLFQVGDDLLPLALAAVAQSLIALTSQPPPMLDDFFELCQYLEAGEAVPFGEMVEALAGTDGAGGEEALHAAVGMARRMARGATTP